MAPPKGGQATKQQPQKQHHHQHQQQRQQQQQQQQQQQRQSSAAASATTATAAAATASPATAAGSAIAKKQPAAVAAPLVRPAVVPAIPLPMIKRQSSSNNTVDKKLGGNSNNPGISNNNNNTANRFNDSRNASRHVPTASTSGRPPVASLEAALIDQQTTATEDSAAMPHRQRPRRNKQNDPSGKVNGTQVEKPAAAAPAAAAAAATTPTNVGHTGDHDKNKNNTQYRDMLHSPTNNATPNGSTEYAHKNVPATQSSNGSERLAHGVANPRPHYPHNPTSTSSSTSAHASNAPSVVGDFEIPVGLPLREPLNGTLPGAAAIVPPRQPDNLVKPTDSHAASHPRFNTNGNDAPIPHVPHPASLYSHNYAHPNGTGLMFGGVPTPDSHTPSPASGAFMPPPAPQHHRPLINGVGGDGHKMNIPANGQHVHAGHIERNGANYAAPITPLRPGAEHMNGMDSYAPMPAGLPVHRAPLDGLPPSSGHFEPPTPHSFHGSHASGDFNGPDNIAPFRPNGYGFDRDPRNSRPQSVHPMQPFAGSQHFPRQPGMEEELMESVMFFQNQFNSADLADCTLELKFPDNAQSTAKIHAHKLILARSPALKQYIMIARAADPGSHIITVNAADRYLRSDAWFMAVQRLYMHALFSPPLNPNGADFGLGNIAQFRFCLGYAAAGHLLEMNDVLLRGLQIAAGMVQWHTIEEALAFAMEGAVSRHFVGEDGNDWADIEFAYGREVRILMASIANFLINCFPPNFQLDTTATHPPNFSRIPTVVADVLQASAGSAPAIARGTSVRRLSKGNRLSVIKFGDLPPKFPEEDAAAAPREPAKCSPQLSRVLLNLPFSDLRYVLASEGNNPQAWNTAPDRHHALAVVVAEREARRSRAVEAVRMGLVPGSNEIQQRLSALRPYDVVECWDDLNWQEEAVQPNGAGLPSLVRRWIPQFGRSLDAAPQVPSFEPDFQDSMV